MIRILRCQSLFTLSGDVYHQGMYVTEEQFRRIEGCFPTQRGNVKVSDLDVLNAILYVAENGCTWRALPK